MSKVTALDVLKYFKSVCYPRTGCDKTCVLYKGTKCQMIDTPNGWDLRKLSPIIKKVIRILESRSGATVTPDSPVEPPPWDVNTKLASVLGVKDTPHKHRPHDYCPECHELISFVLKGQRVCLNKSCGFTKIEWVPEAGLVADCDECGTVRNKHAVFSWVHRQTSRSEYPIIRHMCWACSSRRGVLPRP